MGLSNSGSSVSIPFQGILFDFDGILISSLASAERCWSEWARLRGVDPALAVRTMHGRRAIETVALLCPERDPEAELKVIEDLEMADSEGLTVLPGVLQLLASLPLDRWTVVTSSTERLARARMRAGGVPMPQRLVTAESVMHGKPRPDPFLAGAKMLGFRPEECVVFEDALPGIEAGRAAGCTVVATTFTLPAGELGAADFIVPDLTGVTVESGADGPVLRMGQLVN
jgi:sugar-phosphatase